MGLTGNARRELSPNHNVARYCRPKSIRPSDGLPSRDAFLLRPREEYLSTNWLEYFHESERDVQLGNVRNLLSGKLALASNGRLAILNVAVAVALCQSKEQVHVRFFVLGDRDDPSHTGIYGYAERNKNARVAAVLASAVKPDEVYPALTTRNIGQ